MGPSIASILMEESAMWYSSAASPSRIGMISGWSQTAVAIRPVRSVSGRASRATFRIEEAGYCLTGAIA